MKKCFLTTFALALALAGCAPPYSPELNTSAGLAAQMTLLGTMGPVSSPDGNETTAMKLLPAKPTAATTSLSQLKLTSGFLVSESPGRQHLSWLIQDSDGSVKRTDSNTSFSLAGADPNYPPFEYDVITTTAVATMLVYNLGPQAGTTTYQTFTADLGNPQFLNLQPPTTFLSFFGTQTVLGGQVLPLPGSDQFDFLLNSAGTLLEYTATFASPIFSSSTPVNPSVPALPGLGYRALYYQNGLSGALAFSYASYFTGGQWVCYRWNSSPTSQVLLPAVTRRIDAVLTNGDLISTQDGTLTIYDMNGVKMSSVPLAGMQFCYEAYVGATPYVFFSLSLGFPHESWALRAFAIPTSDLRGLKG